MPLPVSKSASGLLHTLGAFALWGVLPAYWKLLKQVHPVEILANRIIWSLLFTAALILLMRKRADLKRTIANRRNRLFLLATAVLICGNWGLYIYAVNTGHIVESSLGYFITPLFNVALGLIFLGERLKPLQSGALLLATAGLCIRTWHYGAVPWPSLGLALTFALYGLLKKMADLDGIVGLLGETAVLFPLALGFVILRQAQGVGAFATSFWGTTLLLCGAGVVTSVPLLLFAEGARRVPLATVGFAQYLSPSLSLLLGVFAYGESFTHLDGLSFGLVWGALAVYSCAQVREMRGTLIT